MGQFYLRTILISLIVLFVSNFLPAQTLNMQTIPTNRIQLGLSYDKPFFKSNPYYSTTVNVYQFNFSLPISPKMNLIGNIPYINSGYEMNYMVYSNSSSNSGFGNIFIGLQTNPGNESERKSIFSFGVFLPTAENSISVDGLFTNYYEIFKYVPNSMGIYVNYAYHKTSSEGLTYGLEAGPNLLIPTKNSGSGANIYLHYAVNAGFKYNKFSLNAEFLGLALLNKNVNNFSDRLIHQLAFGTQWDGGIITPKIYYRIYLKDTFSNIVDGVLGTGFIVTLN